MSAPPPPPSPIPSSESSESSSSSISSSSSTSQSSVSSSESSSSSTESSSSIQSSSTTLSEPLTSSIETTQVTTSNGQVFTTVFNTQTTFPAGATVTTTSVASAKSNNTGAIVGGVVGGIAFLALLALLTVFLVRRARQKRLEKTFDGNFDPGRASLSTAPTSHHPPGTLPVVGVNVDAEDEDDGMGGRLNGTSVGGGVVSPFVIPPAAPQMSQHGHGYGYPATVQSHTTGGSMATSYYPTSQSSAVPSSNALGAYPHSAAPYPHALGTIPDLPNPHPPALLPGVSGGSGTTSGDGSQSSLTSPGSGGPGMPIPMSGASVTSTSRSGGKQGEAYGRQGFAVANPNPIVHQDAGRVQDEIPPTYDSIPRD